jgi:hypothetical protein
MEMHQSGRLQNDGRAEQAAGAQEKGAQTGDDPVRGAQVGRSFPAAVENEKLMFDKHRLGDDGTAAARSRQSDQGDDSNERKRRRCHALGNINKAFKHPKFARFL